MKRFKYILLLLVVVVGCNVEDVSNYNDGNPPTAPKNLYSITGDNRVDLAWDKNTERDLDYYNVYYSSSYNGAYIYLGSSTTNYYIDYTARNGITYYYAVTAVDRAGNESELSFDEVFDTPRPEGFNQTVFNYNSYPEKAGYSFLLNRTVGYNSNDADFFYEVYNNKLYLDVWSDTDIQDMGATIDIYDISYAPTTGYVPLKAGENIKYSEIFIGHTYVIWTVDNHFAKIRISNVTNERIVFDWAYQTVEGNRELKRFINSFNRHDENKSIIRN